MVALAAVTVHVGIRAGAGVVLLHLEVLLLLMRAVVHVRLAREVLVVVAAVHDGVGLGTARGRVGAGRGGVGAAMVGRMV